KLIILSDIDGLYDGHPHSNNSKLITNVGVQEDVEQYIQESNKGEAEGRGGMGSKLNYAQKTAAKNIPTYIANGKKENT
ncbi:glutamate 5-kinase, partial [Vibrio sp. 404]|nr:glutamate 5-kinase [Vibrio marinisediminis]